MKKYISLIISIISLSIFLSSCGGDDGGDPITPNEENGACLLESLSTDDEYEVKFFYNEDKKLDSAYSRDGNYHNTYKATYDNNGVLTRIDDYTLQPSEQHEYHTFEYDNIGQLIKINHYEEGDFLSSFDSLIYENGKLKYDYVNGDNNIYMEYFWEGNNVVKEIEYFEDYEPFEFNYLYDNANKYSTDFATSYVMFEVGTVLFSGVIFSENNFYVEGYEYTYNSKNYPEKLYNAEYDETTTFNYSNCE